MENITKVIVLVFIGIFLHRMKEAFIILFSFCIVRIHAGGIHAKSSLGCTAFMIVVEIGSLIANQYLQVSGVTYLVLGFLSNILIWFYAPNGSKSCALLERCMRYKKRRNALCTANILFLLGLCMKIEKLIFIPVFLETLSLLFFRIQRKAGCEESKTVDW